VNPLQFPVRLVLVGVLALLATFAYASPPDPTWISGLWDDGDHDDVVIRITASAGVVEPFPLDHASSILPVIALLYHTDERSPSSDAPSVIHARAPPAF
jgi:hypothetical protein